MSSPLATQDPWSTNFGKTCGRVQRPVPSRCTCSSGNSASYASSHLSLIMTLIQKILGRLFIRLGKKLETSSISVHNHRSGRLLELCFSSRLWIKSMLVLPSKPQDPALQCLDAPLATGPKIAPRTVNPSTVNPSTVAELFRCRWSNTTGIYILYILYIYIYL